MRPHFAFLLLFLLAACGDSGDATEDALAAAGEKAADNGRIKCAIEGAETFESVCTLDRVVGEEGPILTIHHPNGGFRRLLITSDGRGVVAADGAEQTKVTPLGHNRIEVSLAGDRYELPATVKAAQPSQ